MQKYAFENLPLQPAQQAGDFLVYAIVEQAHGTTERTVWDEQRHEFVKTGVVLSVPLPAPYGWIPQTLCEGDGDALDVLILTQAPLPQGHFLAVRPLGVLLRHDLDHKVLAADIEDAQYGQLRSYRELPPATVTLIEDWFRPYFQLDGWLDAAGAQQLILDSHALFTSKSPKE